MGTKQYDSATDLITFSRASSATFLGSNGLLQTAANNIPRIEYDATGAVKGLLIEEARTNILRHSSDYTVVDWTKNGTTVTASAGVSPSGLTDASLITASEITDQHRIYQNRYNLGTHNTFYTKSIYAKSGTANYISVGGGTVAVGYAVFNLSTGVVSSQANIQQANIEDVGGGWYRCSIHGTVASTFLVVNIGTTAANAVPQVNWLGAGETVQVYGSQWEAGAFPTSYIPTTGATATRARDLAEIPTSAFGYNNDQGSVAVEFKSNKPSSDFYGAFVLSDGSPTNRIIHHTFNGGHRGAVVSSGVSEVNVVAGSRGAPSELVKFAVGFSDNNFAASLNGATAVTDTSVTIPSGLSKLALGYYYPTNAQSNMLNGHIKSIQYYPRRLTDTQLQELTT